MTAGRADERGHLKRAGIAYWLCMRGHKGARLPARWLEAPVAWEVMSGFATPPRRTLRIRPGDRVIWYATGKQKVFGIATVVDEPVNRTGHDQQEGRWPWLVPTRTEFVIDDLDDAPTLADAGLGGFWVQRMSYRELTAEQFAALEGVIRPLARPAPPPPSELPPAPAAVPTSAPCAPGHVFVTRGDLTTLACDAWLLPTDRFLTIEMPWRAHVPDGSAPRPAEWGDAVRSVPTRADGHGPWLTDVGGVPGSAVEWYLDAVRQFVHRAAATLPHTAVDRRERRLIALPLVGTRAGGARAVSGEMTTGLIRVLIEVASETGMDIALVTHTDAAYAAAQATRRRREQAGDQLWAALSPDLEATARSLAQHAQAGELVLFLGAGVSVPAGLPTWNALLAGLARDVDYPAERRAQLLALPAVDAARLIELHAGGAKTLAPLIAARFAVDQCALGHTLLAGLGVHEVVTTNYDTLYELARRGAGSPVAVLPYRAALGPEGWLLKLHGCITRPDDIVLTRDDYLRYESRRAALAGIVQALLITRHMLFVGFSLTDDNFHRIVYEVRTAIGAEHRQRLGTALLLKEDPTQAELWSQDLSLTAMAPLDTDTSTSSRRLEIFLDRLLYETSDNSAHLLNPDFAGVLTPAERALSDVLRPVLEAGDEVREARVWRKVTDLLADLGGNVEG